MVTPNQLMAPRWAPGGWLSGSGAGTRSAATANLWVRPRRRASPATAAEGTIRSDRVSAVRRGDSPGCAGGSGRGVPGGYGGPSRDCPSLDRLVYLTTCRRLRWATAAHAGGKEEADPEDSWRPLSVRRGLRDDRVLTEGVPPHLAGPLEPWLRPLLTARRGGDRRAAAFAAVGLDVQPSRRTDPALPDGPRPVPRRHRLHVADLCRPGAQRECWSPSADPGASGIGLDGSTATTARWSSGSTRPTPLRPKRRSRQGRRWATAPGRSGRDLALLPS